MLTNKEITAKARESLRGKWLKAALLTLVFIAATFIGIFLIEKGFGLIMGESLSNEFFGTILISVAELCLVFPMGIGYTCFFNRLVSGERALFSNLHRPYRTKYWRNVVMMAIQYLAGFIAGVVAFIPVIIAVGIAALETVDPDNLSAAQLMEESLMSGDVLFPILIGSIIAVLIFSAFFFIIYPPAVICYYIASVTKKITAVGIIKQSFALLKGHKTQFWMLNLRITGWVILAGITFGIGFLWVAPYISTIFAVYYQEIKKQYALEHPEA